MKVIIQKPDLDTCLTAFIMGVSEEDEIIISKSDASEADILNSEVLCIEAGGSGLIELNNFDHHEPDKYFPPACRQSFKSSQKSGVGSQESRRLERLVDYVCIVDDGPRDHPAIAFPSLSNIFSGMLFVEKGKLAQFFKGMEILQKVLDEDIDPFSTMPDLTEWKIYKEAKEENQCRVEEVIRRVEFYESKSGIKIGYVQSDFIGGIGALYSQGCDVVIMYNPAFGEPPVKKYTIAGNNKKVSHLLEHFDKIEKGWGGRETIIGSPRKGTMINKNKVIDIVMVNL